MRVRIMGRDLDVTCAAGQERRLADLALALDSRLSRSPEGDDVLRLSITALALIDEAQTAHAALERARLEIERLNDLLVEQRLAADAQIGPGDSLSATAPVTFAVQGNA